jgi:hypothetical protein
VKTEEYRRSIVRVRNAEGKILGLGLLVGERHVVTCAHVVNVAIGKDQREQSQPDGSRLVQLEFCHLSGDPGRMARVVAWASPPTADATGGDIAGLLLTDDAPAESIVVSFASQPPEPGAALHVFGYPNDVFRPNGMWVDLDFKGQVGGHSLQVESREGQSIKAQPGYSGSPVFDPKSGKAVGLLQTTTYADGTERDAYLVPPLGIAEVWEAPFDYLLIPPTPYRGLQTFTSADEDVFFGRDSEIEELAKRVEKQPVVIVVGPSGVGKSSLVQSGLLPALAESHPWSTAVVRPGLDPWPRLARELLRAELGADAVVTPAEIRDRVELLRSEGLNPTLSLLRSLDRPLVLVIDQFEELLTGDDAPDLALLDLLIPSPDLTSDAGRIVLTLRASFQPVLQTIPGVHNKLNERLYLLSPLTPTQMAQVVERPANARGVVFEQGLVKRIVEEASGVHLPVLPKPADDLLPGAAALVKDEMIGEAAGSLPVLEFTLTQLWDTQRRRTITHAGYDEMGGVRGALNRFAEQKAAELSDTAADVLDRVLLQLVSSARVGGTDLVVRRRVFESEILEPEWDVLCRLADARLVTIDSNSTGGASFAELAHEALITAWERLAALVNENVAFLNWLGRVQERVSHGDTLPDSWIEESRGWITSRPESVSPAIREFVLASETSAEANLRRVQDARADAVKRWVQTNSALGLIIQSLADGDPVETVVQLVVFTAAQLIGPQPGARSCYFELEAGTPMMLVPARFFAGRNEPALHTADVEYRRDVVSIVVNKEPLFVPDASVDSEIANLPPRGHRTFICAPVYSRNVAYGMLSVDAPQPGDLDHRDVDLLSQMAGLVAIAMRDIDP